MIETKDIKERIELDYGDRSSEVISIFNAAISKADYLNENRIIRCILFLAGTDIEKLIQYIEVATSDPRDVIYWAEYIHHDEPEKTKRVRDFNNPFPKSEEGI